jgi:RHS repeat-associated protein
MVRINESTANTARWYNEPFDHGTNNYIHQGLSLSKGLNVDLANLYVSSYNTITGVESERTKFILSNENLIIENTIKTAGLKNGNDLLNTSLNEVNQTVTFFDGMSRPMQNVMVQSSPTQKDIVSVTKLSPVGRVVKSFLPYSISNNNNNYYRPSFEQECKDFYSSSVNVNQPTNYPYSEKSYEMNRLGRLLETSNAGDTWQLGTQHTVKNSYRFNTLNEVRKYQYNGLSYQVSGYYEPSTIKVEQLKDENDNYSLNYIDILGRVICTNKKMGNSNITTYNIYDDNSNLIYVIQPEGMPFNELTPEVVSKFVFAYEYDDQGRMIVKKIPGKGVEYFIYNDRDQLVLSQDAAMRSNDAAKWKFFKYDALGRMVYTGITIISSYSSAQSLQNTVSAITDPNLLVVNREEFGFGYTNTIFPIVSESEITNITFYDTYSNFPTASSFENSSGYNLYLNGQITKQVKRKINDNGTLDDSNWYNTYFYYDDKYRLLKTIEEQEGFIVISNNTYDFVGNILTATKVIKNNTNAAENVTVLKSYSYDHQNRLLSVSEKINNLPAKILLNNVYDELGKLVKVNKNMVDNKPLFTTEFNYNIRNWQTKINAFWSKTITNCETNLLFNPIDILSIINRSENDELFYRSIDGENPNAIFAEFTAEQYVNALELYGFTDNNFYDALLSVEEQPTQSNKDIFKNQVSLALQEQISIDFPEQRIPLLEFKKVNESIQFKLNQINENKIIPIVSYTNCYTKENRYNLFNQEMLYETTDNHTNTPAQFNGNISAIRWKTGTDAVREYGHRYDSLNRLTASDYTSLVGSTWTNTSNYDVNGIVYDNNGNVQTMTQYGKVDPNTFNKIDQLSYTYEGNRLVKVSDAIAPNPSRGDFSDGVELVTEYLYDANGNMIEDKNKGITIWYNYLNLPSKVTFVNGNSISYIYDTNGNKQKMIVTQNVGNSITQNTTDYVNGFVYVNNALNFFANETGRVLKTASGFQTEYVINDHLGNARMTVVSNENNEPEILQYDSYYPFGLEMGGLSYVSSTENKYKYNGKEKQDALGLGWYDYGARFYDPQIGRWNVVDPLAEERLEWTSYNYCSNNPVLRIDPDGALDGDYYTKSGKYLGTDGNDDKRVYSTTEKTANSAKVGGTINAEMVQVSSDTKYIGQQSDLVNMNGHKITSTDLKQSLTGFSIFLGTQSGKNYTQITLTGGDRSASRNAAVGGAFKSTHIDGTAADIKVYGLSNEALSLKAGASGLFGGVIFYPNAGDNNGFGKGYTQKLPAHTHVDMRTSSYFGRYIGHDGEKNRYTPWISNTQIR